jgi:ribosome maturation factor RimP
MTKLATTIKNLVEAEAADFGAFVVGSSSGEKGLLRYYVDSEQVLTMNTLTEITRNVNKKMDEMDLGDEAFTFEVSSPGADNPLSDLRQYGKHIGRLFELETEDENLEAKLMEVKSSILVFEKTSIEKVGGKKTTITEQIEIPFEKIKKATIKISFK